MMTQPNPYTASDVDVSSPPRERKVMFYLASACILLLLALVVGWHGLVLLNQELGWFPVRGRYIPVEVDGRIVPLRVMMWKSLLYASAPGLLGIFCGVVGMFNWLQNSHIRRTKSGSSDQEGSLDAKRPEE